MNKILGAVAAGLLFGIGLTLSGMVDPNKVINFLDVTGNWDPSLMFVLGGAVITTTLAFRFILKLPKPLFDVRFQLPTNIKVDRPLILGSALFGAGWGLIGYCPGPAVASLALKIDKAIVVISAMVAGMILHKLAKEFTSKSKKTPTNS